MSEWDQVKKGEESLKGWQQRATRKDPKKLIELSRENVVRTTVENCLQNNDYYRGTYDLLRSSLPLNIRTDTVEAIANHQPFDDPEQIVSLLLLQLLTDVRHLSVTTGRGPEDAVVLGQKQCDFLLKEISSCDHFNLESLTLEGIATEEEGLLTEILRRSPNVRSIHVSGNLCDEILQYLREHPCRLQALQLDSCTVKDKDVVEALLGNYNDFETIGNTICEGTNVNEKIHIAHGSLTHLSVQSPSLTVCGAMVLIHCLKELTHFHYTCWNSSVFDALCFLRSVSPQEINSPLLSLAIDQPKAEAIEKVAILCPRLRRLQIESCDPTVESLDALSSLKELQALSFHLVSEDLILSAVKAVGENLLELNIEFESCAFHTISFELLKAIQECCPLLQKLTIGRATIKVDPKEYLPLPKSAVYPELRQLTLRDVVIQPVVLEHIIVRNKVLEQLVLDVNQDGVTDSVMSTLLKNSSLERLKSVSINSGFVSANVITTILTLPSLTKLSLNFEKFPFISSSTFDSLKADLHKGNFQCAIENIIHEEETSLPYQ